MASKPNAATPSKDDGDHRSGNRDKTPAPAPTTGPHLKCPRCDSSNTKFCYYNNYSLSQPRYFCKTCRRYWTKGGALRNVPIGGGCRKNKKILKQSSSSTPSSFDVVNGGLRFLHCLSPTVGFQLGALNSSKTAALFASPANMAAPNPCFSSLNNTSSSSTASSLFGLNFSFPCEMGTNNNNNNNNIASSIESLSSINQDLHWKLQQQRLGTSSSYSPPPLENIKIQKPQEIMFQNLKEISRKSEEGNEWLFGNANSGMIEVNPNTVGNGNDNGNAMDWNRIQANWSNLNHYSALP